MKKIAFLLILFLVVCDILQERKKIEVLTKDVYVIGFLDGWIFVLRHAANLLLGIELKKKEAIDQVMLKKWEETLEEIQYKIDSLNIKRELPKEGLRSVYEEGFSDGVIWGTKDVRRILKEREFTEISVAQKSFERKKGKLIKLLLSSP